MPLDYDSLLATATSTIALLGREGILQAIDGSTQTPITVLLSNSGAPERDGSLISRAEQRALVAAKPGVNPDPEQHRLVLDGLTYRIVSARPLQPSHTALYFDCLLRRQ